MYKYSTINLTNAEVGVVKKDFEVGVVFNCGIEVVDKPFGKGGVALDGSGVIAKDID